MTYYIHGLENVTGSANVTVSAPGFTGGSHAVDVVPSGIEIVGLNTETTTLSADDTDWYVQVGLPCAGNTQLCTVQNVRPGAPLFVVTLALAPAQTPIAQLRSDQPVATGQTVTKPIQPGIYYTQAIVGGTSYGLTFDPLAGGQTSVTATGPAGVLTMTTTGVRPVTISGPTISVQSAQTVGAGLQVSTFAILGASEHGGVDVTVQSNDPSRVLVSRDASTAGTASATVNVPNGQTFVTYYIHGVENVSGLGERHRLRPGLHRRLACRRRRPERYRDSSASKLRRPIFRRTTRIGTSRSVCHARATRSCARSRTSAPVGRRSSLRLPAPTAMLRVCLQISRLRSVRSSRSLSSRVSITHRRLWRVRLTGSRSIRLATARRRSARPVRPEC